MNELNIDCVYLIFEKLDLKGLVNIVRTNTKFTDVAVNIFRRKYSDYEIYIEPDTNVYQETCIIDTTPKKIRFCVLEFFTDFMKSFGNNIEKFFIPNNENNYTVSSDWAKANRVMNKYASESIVQLYLGIFSKDLWPQYTVPMKNVKNLTVSLHNNTDGMNLSQIFPNVEVLYIELIGAMNFEFIDCELPHLQHLKISIERNAWHNGQKIIEFIKKNPQIRSVDATRAPQEFYHVLQLLPNLENLTILYENDEDQLLHFNSVKHCDLHLGMFPSLKNLSFSQLESYQFMFFSMELDTHTEFFRRHQNINRLHLIGTIITTMDLREVTDVLPNLEEMIVDNIRIESDIENIVEFIDKHTKLRKFQFRVYRTEENERQLLRELFEPNWKISNFDDSGDSFLFERKNE